MDVNVDKPHAEQRCIFFLVPLVLGCTIVAALTCEAVHLLMRFLAGYPMTEHWAVFLVAGAAVAAVVALGKHIAVGRSHLPLASRHA